MGLRLEVEKYLPVSVGLISFATLMAAKPYVVALFEAYELNGGSLYASVFDWASIQTGFMFGVYGFVVGKSDGFIAEVRNSKAMARFVSYTWTATLIGFILTLVSMPLIVASPSIGGAQFLLYALVCAWFSLFLFGFAAFLRVAYIFGIIVRPKPPEIIRG